MTVIVNGEAVILDDATTAAEFLKSKGINEETVVVEYNGSILPRESFDKTVLKDKDTLEVLRFVGGG